MAELPPWLDVHPGDIAADYTRGVQIGVGIGQEKARLQVEQQRMSADIAARQETAQRELLMQQQQLAMQKAYHEATVGVRQRALDEAAKVNAAKTQAAAQKFAQQAQLNKLIQANPNVDPMRLAFQAGAGTPQMAEALSKSELSARQFADKVRHERAMEARGTAGGAGKIGTMDIPLPPPPGGSALIPPTLKGVPINSPVINAVMGTNAPPLTGTNYPAAPPPTETEPAMTPDRSPVVVTERRGNLMPSDTAATNAPPQYPPDYYPKGSIRGAVRRSGLPTGTYLEPKTNAPSPFKEGQLLRDKKTGKKYQVKNGEPVEVTDE